MCLNLNLVLFKKVRYFVLGYYYSFTTNVWTKLSTQVEYEVANLFLELCKVKPKLYIYIQNVHVRWKIYHVSVVTMLKNKKRVKVTIVNL